MATITYPEGPKTSYPLQHLLALSKDPIGFISRLSQGGEKIIYFPMGGRPTYLLNHPDLVQEVLATQHQNFTKGSGLIRLKQILGDGLITSEDPLHLRQRRLSQPAFHRQRIAAYGAVMSDYAYQARERWKEGETIDIEPETARITMAIVGKTLLNADVEGEAYEIAEAVDTMRERFHIAVFPGMQLLDKLPLPHNFRFNKARRRLNDTIYRMIAERRSSGADRGDLLSMLILARDTEGDQGGMTDLQVRDEAMTIFLAGYETITNTLTWTWYLLSQHPDIEAKFHAELDGLKGKVPTMEDLARLPYTQKILTEAMRLYPAAWMIAREPLEECQVGGYTIPANSILFMCPYTIHRLAEYYPDPEKFDPERWEGKAKDSRPRFAYFPFGGGPRQCIGEPYALMEGALILATIAQKWKLRMVKDHPVTIQANVTIRPKYGMPMVLEKRA